MKRRKSRIGLLPGTVLPLLFMPLVFLVSTQSAMARCYGSSISFRSQSEFNQFFQSFPDIDCFLNNVTLDSSIQDLSAMAGVRTINGRLTISSSSPSLHHLTGLEEVSLLVLNRAKSIPQIAQLPNLKTLSRLEFSNCHKQVLKDVYFKGLTKLDFLVLSGLDGAHTLNLPNLSRIDHIQISNINPHEGDSMRFPALEEVVTIVIQNLTEIDFIEFEALKTVEGKINLNNVDLTENEVFKLPELNHVKALEFRFCNNIEIIDLPQVQTLEAANLEYISGLKNIQLPKLSDASILHLNLSRIDTDSFKIYTENPISLNVLQIGYSDIQFLELPKLYSINEFKTFELNVQDFKVLDKDVKVTVASFQNSVLMGLNKISNRFVETNNVQFLNCNLSGQDIGFQKIKKLEYLNINDCKLDSSGGLGNLAQVVVLRFVGCTSSAPSALFKNIKTISSLTILNNGFQFDGYFEDLDSVGYFSLQNSGNGDRIDAFNHLRKVHELELSNIQAITLDGFDRLNGLVILNISYCDKLEEFNGLRNLESLRSVTIDRSNGLRKIAHTKMVNELSSLRITKCSNLVDVGFVQATGKLDYLELRELGVIKQAEGLKGITEIRTLEIVQVDSISLNVVFSKLVKVNTLVLQEAGLPSTQILFPVLKQIYQRCFISKCPVLYDISFNFDFNYLTFEMFINENLFLEKIDIKNAGIQNLIIEGNVIKDSISLKALRTLFLQVKDNKVKKAHADFVYSEYLHTPKILIQRNQGLTQFHQTMDTKQLHPIELSITDNIDLEEIHLEKLDSIGVLMVQRNQDLKKVEGSETIRTINQAFISTSTALEVLDLNGLREVEDLEILDLTDLNEVKLQSLKSIIGRLVLDGNIVLKSFEIPNSLINCAGSVTISNNYFLQEVKGGGSLKSFPSTLTMDYNFSLTRFDAFQQVDPISVKKVSITNCANLNACNSVFLCEMHAQNLFALDLAHNGDLCSTRKDIGHFCTYIEAPFHPSITDGELRCYQDLIEFKHLIIYNSLGQRQMLIRTSNSIDVSHFRPGVYIIKYTYLGADWQQKIIKI
jgi:hypothetical protein